MRLLTPGPHFARAVGIFSGCILKRPDLDRAYYLRARAYTRLRRPADALADLATAIRLDPQYAVAYNSRAWMRFEAKQLTQGLADIQRSLDLSADDAASLDTRADIYEALGRREDAIADYKRVLALLPERHSQAQPIRDALKRLGAPVQ